MASLLARGLCMGLLSVMVAVAAMAAERIPLYTYYADPPFAADSPDSLTDRLADWLTQRAHGRYRFVPTQLPRRRLDVLIHQPHWPGVVVWANPDWFGESSKPRQSWTRSYMADANLVVSLRSDPIDFVDDRSLEGRRVGSVLGYLYPDLDQLIKSGRLTRDDANSEFQNLLKLKLGRVHVAFLQASSFPYFRQREPDMAEWAYVAPKPRTVFERSMFVAPGQPELLAFLNVQLDALVEDRDWQGRLGTCALIGPASAKSRLCR